MESRCSGKIGAPGEIARPILGIGPLRPGATRRPKSLQAILSNYAIAAFRASEKLARPERFELPTSWFVAMRSIQLSYGRAASALRTPAREGGSRGPRARPGSH